MVRIETLEVGVGGQPLGGCPTVVRQVVRPRNPYGTTLLREIDQPDQPLCRFSTWAYEERWQGGGPVVRPSSDRGMGEGKTVSRRRALGAARPGRKKKPPMSSELMCPYCGGTFHATLTVTVEDSGGLKPCNTCGRVYPEADFITRNGKLSPSCKACRREWAKSQEVS